MEGPGKSKTTAHLKAMRENTLDLCGSSRVISCYRAILVLALSWEHGACTVLG